MQTPLVSVLMPVFNGSKFLRASIESILKQAYTNFEFIIINDGSKDSTEAVIKEYAEKDIRIRLKNHAKNLGIVVSLNEGIKMAKGKYILRMDADDIADKNRFTHQIEFMELHPTVGVCGTWIKVLSDNPYIWRPPITNAAIQTSLFFESVIAHPTACIRVETLKSANLKYNPRYIYVEDYQLWTEISKKWEIANLPEVLLSYRSHPNQTSNLRAGIQSANLLKLKSSLLSDIYPHATSNDLNVHLQAMGWPVAKSIPELDTLKKWYILLLKCNKKINRYSKKIFTYKIAEKWVGVCHLAKKIGIIRYFYIFTIPELIIPSLYIVIQMRMYSVKEYIKATIKRFL